MPAVSLPFCDALQSAPSIWLTVCAWLMLAQVFVAGATGNTGRRVVQQLRAAGFRVRAGVRVRACACGGEWRCINSLLADAFKRNVCTTACLLCLHPATQDERKAQALGFALDPGIVIVTADVTKDVGCVVARTRELLCVCACGRRVSTVVVWHM